MLYGYIVWLFLCCVMLVYGMSAVGLLNYDSSGIYPYTFLLCICRCSYFSCIVFEVLRLFFNFLPFLNTTMFVYMAQH